MSKAEDRRRDDPAAPWNKRHKPRAKKDTRRWCLGKMGREHVTEILIDDYFGPKSCRNLDWRTPPWFCMHIERCQICGKKLRHLEGRECPDYPARKVASV